MSVGTLGLTRCKELEVEETLVMGLQLKLTWVVLSECLVSNQSIVWQPIIMEQLPKLAIGKIKKWRFESQWVLFWERLGKTIYRAFRSVFWTPHAIIMNPRLRWIKIGRTSSCYEWLCLLVCIPKWIDCVEGRVLYMWSCSNIFALVVISLCVGRVWGILFREWCAWFR